MHLTPSTSGLLLGLMSVVSCAAAPAGELDLAPTSTCARNITCHTYTAYTTPVICPKIQCPHVTGICPQYISVSTSKVPCSTNCCPTTSTRTIITPCPTCPTGCVIPTRTVTLTTGCKTTITPTTTETGGASVTLIPGGGDGGVTLSPGRL